MSTFFAWLLLGASFLQPGQDSGVSIEQLRTKIETLTANQTQGERDESLAAALELLTAAQQSRERAQTHREDTAKAPAILATIESELASLEESPEYPDHQNLEFSELSALLEQARAEVESTRQRVEQLQATATQREARTAVIPQTLAVLAAQELEVKDTLDGLETGSESEKVLTEARLEDLRARIDQLKAERDFIEAAKNLLPLRIERAQRMLTLAQNAEAHWSGLVDTQRTDEAERTAREASQQFEETLDEFPKLAALAESTSELAKRRVGEQGTTTQIREAVAAYNRDQERLSEIKKRSRSAHRRVDAGGLTEAMGSILRKDFEWLPSLGKLRAESRQLENTLAEAQLELITLEENGDEGAGVAGQTAELLLELGVGSADEQVRDYARELVAAHGAARDSLIADLRTLVSTCNAHRETQLSLVLQVREYRKFIEQQILWIRSTSLNPWTSLRRLGTHAQEIAKQLDGSFADAERTKGRSRAVVVAVISILLLLARRFLIRKRHELGDLSRSYKTDKYLHTIRAVVQSALLALPLPLLLLASGLACSDSPQELTHAWSSSAPRVVLAWMTLAFAAQLVCDHSLGQIHFRWQGARVAECYRVLSRGQWLFVPACALFSWLDAQSNASWSNSWGRIGFVIACCALSFMLWRCLRVNGTTETNLVHRTKKLWAPLAASVPLILAGLALVGFYYTALQFELRVRYTIVFLLALTLMSGLMHRWLFIARRRLAVAQALEARARREEEAESSPGMAPSLEPEQIDIPAIDAQTRRLFQSSVSLLALVGIFLLWSNVLPALQGLDRVQLYPEVRVLAADAEDIRPDSRSEFAELGSTPQFPVPGSLTSELNQGDASDSANAIVNITLADLLLALLIVVLTVAAARNFPALLELALLQRLPLDAGARYAISTIVRYLIVLAGLSGTSSALGIGWDRIQWLAAALTFGLAFGLQEIFANFVSGLIILIERPIRVGDTISVGGIEGRVTQLRMRATTIQDYDLRELLVPNKEFITGQVINWTLSDPVTRLIIPVGIAYGSDTALAKSALADVARKNELVLDTPPPHVTFRSFGESSLDMELRVFIPNRDVWAACTDQLHTQIDERFRQEGIEIAFPQRDIHIRSNVDA